MTKSEQRQTTLDRALALAARGIPVFPCHNATKRPACKNGFKDASTDPDTIRALFADAPADSLIGFPTGAASGWCILDLDVKPERDSAPWLAANSHRLPPTLVQTTRSLGTHWYFRHYPGLRNSNDRIAPGVDIRADGGYAIAWGEHGCSLFLDEPVAPFPEWLADLAIRSQPAERSGPVDLSDLAAPSVAAVVELLDRMPNPDDTNRETWLRVMLGSVGAMDGLGDTGDEIPDAACRWAARWSLSLGFDAEREKWDSDFATRDAPLAGWRTLESIAGQLIPEYRYESACAEFMAHPLPPPPPGYKPDLVVSASDLPSTVRHACKALARDPETFNRGGIPVILTQPAGGGAPEARRLTAHGITMRVHSGSRVVRRSKDGETIPTTYPERAARMTEDEIATGKYLRPLSGITTAPLLRADGTISTAAGYDATRQMWCEPGPPVAVPDNPTAEQAVAALRRLRLPFAGFPFADAETINRNGVPMVDQSRPPGMMESTALAALLTAVCRPSLPKAPGLCVTAASLTGAGTGKGLLVRGIAEIAYGVQPAAMTCGHDRNELDKRIVAALMQADQMLFLDNMNSAALQSDSLASVMTENPARVRIMGASQMVPLNCGAFIAITGNGLALSEDLMRRFLMVRLDARMDDPEARAFPTVPGFLENVRCDRLALLGGVLTILRWGLQSKLPPGLPLGSFETWGAWVRDPLIALGCRDPVEQIRASKANDPRRAEVAALFTVWWDCHNCTQVRAAELAHPVETIINPHKAGPRHVTARLSQLVGTRAGGFVLTSTPAASAASKRGATYALCSIDSGGPGFGHAGITGMRELPKRENKRIIETREWM